MSRKGKKKKNPREIQKRREYKNVYTWPCVMTKKKYDRNQHRNGLKGEDGQSRGDGSFCSFPCPFSVRLGYIKHFTLYIEKVFLK